MKAQNKVIVVTGAGSGMGRELTLQLVAKGATVAALDIREETLQETLSLLGDKQSMASTHIVNVADQATVEALPEKLIALHGQVDGIINNAGIIQPFYKLHALDYDTIRRVVDVNFWGTLYMTKAFLPHLLKRPEAHVVNISSMGGFFPFPGQTIYGATKAAVKLMTEGLYAEMQGTSVKASVVFPGAIATNITTNSGIDVPETDSASDANMRALSAKDAASQIIQGMEKDKLKILVGKDAKFMNILYTLSPRRAIRFINKQMQGLIQE